MGDLNGLVLFDGVCNLCNQTIQFIIKRDNKRYFKFTSLQSEAGQRLLNEYGIDKNIDSIVLIENNKYYMKSSAVLRIFKNLNGFWKILNIFLIIPTPIRNIIYDMIARNGYIWFGKRDSCMLPSSETKKRFIE